MNYDTYTGVALIRALKDQLATISVKNGYLLEPEGRIYPGDADPWKVPRPSFFLYTTDQTVLANQPIDFYDLATQFFVDFIDNVPPDSDADEYLTAVVSEVRRCLGRTLEFPCVKEGQLTTFKQPARVKYTGRSCNFGPPMPGVCWVEIKFLITYRDFCDDPRYGG